LSRPHLIIRHHPAQFTKFDHNGPQRWQREFNELGLLTLF
jgi:hypothetical protein